MRGETLPAIVATGAAPTHGATAREEPWRSPAQHPQTTLDGGTCRPRAIFILQEALFLKLRSVILALTAMLMLGAALPARAQDPTPARKVATSFYSWYVKHNDTVWKQLGQVKPLFEAGLYQKLQAWYKSGRVDFDPFCNAQMDTKAYTLGAVKFERDFALIPVTCTLSRGGKTHLTLVLHRAVDHYEIWNFIYAKDFDLRTFLEKKG